MKNEHVFRFTTRATELECKLKCSIYMPDWLLGSHLGNFNFTAWSMEPSTYTGQPQVWKCLIPTSLWTPESFSRGNFPSISILSTLWSSTTPNKAREHNIVVITSGQCRRAYKRSVLSPNVIFYCET